MQSLKQLSFLAAGNTAAIQPTPNYQANSYQQAVPIHQPQNYSNEVKHNIIPLPTIFSNFISF